MRAHRFVRIDSDGMHEGGWTALEIDVSWDEFASITKNWGPQVSRENMLARYRRTLDDETVALLNAWLQENPHRMPMLSPVKAPVDVRPPLRLLEGGALK